MTRHSPFVQPLRGWDMISCATGRRFHLRLFILIPFGDKTAANQRRIRHDGRFQPRFHVYPYPSLSGMITAGYRHLMLEASYHAIILLFGSECMNHRGMIFPGHLNPNRKRAASLPPFWSVRRPVSLPMTGPPRNRPCCRNESMPSFSALG